MQEWILTHQELLYCAAQTGAQRFFGIDDPFYAMEPEEIRAAIGQIQQSLEKKGVARLGFDDSFALLPQAAELVGICAGCQSYLLLKRTQQRLEHTVRVYFKDGKAAVAADAPEGIALAEAPAQTLAEQLVRELPSVSGGETGEGIRLAYTLLSQVQQKAAEDAGAARQLLTEQGAAEDLARRLVRCFGCGGDRAVLCKADLGRRSLDTAVLLFDDGGILCMTPADVEEQIWLIRPVAPEQIQAVVSEFLQEVAGQ